MVSIAVMTAVLIPALAAMNEPRAWRNMMRAFGHCRPWCEVRDAHPRHACAS
jgi:hypothetical protein